MLLSSIKDDMLESHTNSPIEETRTCTHLVSERAPRSSDADSPMMSPAKLAIMAP